MDEQRQIQLLERLRALKAAQDEQPAKEPAVDEPVVAPQNSIASASETPQEPGFFEQIGETISAGLSEIPLISELGRMGSAGIKSAFGDKTYDEELQAERDRAKVLQERNPVASTVGGIAGSMAIPGGMVAQLGVTAADTALRTNGDLEKIGSAAGIEALAGGTMKGLGKIASKVAEPMQKIASRAAEKAAGLSSSKKLIKQQLQKQGIGKYSDGEIGDLLVEEGIVTKFSSPEKIYDRLQEKMANVGQDIDFIANRTGTPVDANLVQKKLSEKLASVKGAGPKSEGVRESIRKTGEQFEDLYMKGADEFDMAGILEERRRLGKAFKNPNADPTSVEADRKIYDALNDTIKETVERDQGKQSRELLEKLNKKYEMMSLASEGALNQAASKGGLAQKAGTGMIASGNVAGGLALKSQGWATQHAESLAAAGFHKGSKILKGDTKWSKALKVAAERGTIPTTHMLLMKRDHKYREAFNKEQAEAKEEE